MSIEDGVRKKRKHSDTADESQTVDLQGAAACSFVIEDLHRRGLPILASSLTRANPHTKRDPVVVLGKDLCHHIFSFLCQKPDIHKGGKPKYKTGFTTGFTKQEWLCGIAGKLYSQLRSVSSDWKSTFDGIAWADWVGTVEVEFESVDSEQSQSMINWLCRYKIQLGNVFVAKLIRAMHVPLFTKLITGCQTKGLYGLYFATEELHKIHPAAEKNLHDTVVQQCPNIKNLGLSLSLPKNTPIYKDYVSKALFSIPSITCLHIAIKFLDDIGPAAVDPKRGTKTPIEGRVITNLIQNLPDLHTLRIQTISKGRELHCKNQGFHIESKTLECLSATKFFKGAVLSLDCPALKRFGCDGGPDGNGCLPNNQLSRGRYQHILAQNGGYRLKTSAATPWMTSPLLQVPNDCTFYLHNFRKWGDQTNGYEELMQHSNDFATATYETFVED